MTVTKVEKSKIRRHFDVYIDDELTFSAFDEILSKYDIYETAEIDSKALFEAKSAQMELYAKTKALDMLSRRDYSKSDLKKKLMDKGISALLADVTISKLEDIGLLSDERYATRYCDYLFNVKKYGALRVKGKLYEKGISSELADACIKEHEESCADRLLGILNNKFKKETLLTRDGATKAAAKLYRLGYKYNEIREAIRQYTDIDLDEE